MVKPLTGRKVFAFVASAFGVIIAVNITMAVMAVRTFPGLEVKNSYVASQTFDADRTAQKALGWQLASDYVPGELRLTFTDASGLPAQVSRLSATIGRTTMAGDDLRPEFEQVMGRFTAPVDLGPGKWMVLLEAFAPDGTRFHQRLDLFVKG